MMLPEKLKSKERLARSVGMKIGKNCDYLLKVPMQRNVYLIFCFSKSTAGKMNDVYSFFISHSQVIALSIF